MSSRPTPPLSPEGVAEIVAEMEAAPVNSPERRATFARARAAQFLVGQMLNNLLAQQKKR